jgi:hypothetical protein
MKGQKRRLQQRCPISTLNCANHETLCRTFIDALRWAAVCVQAFAIYICSIRQAEGGAGDEVAGE